MSKLGNVSRFIVLFCLPNGNHFFVFQLVLLWNCRTLFSRKESNWRKVKAQNNIRENVLMKTFDSPPSWVLQSKVAIYSLTHCVCVAIFWSISNTFINSSYTTCKLQNKVFTTPALKSITFFYLLVFSVFFQVKQPF